LISADTYGLYKNIYQQLTYLWLAPWAVGGTVVGVLILCIKTLQTDRLDGLLRLVVTANFVLLIVVALSYLFYPGYLDHAESSIASLGLIFQQNGQIFPALSEYTMHGLMYGPLFSEIQALLGLINLPVIVSSKLLGIAAFIFSSFLFLKIFHNSFARSYLIFLIPFGMFNYWNRAEPLFILAVTFTLVLARQPIKIKTSILLGCLAGLAAGLKIHAAIYILAAIVVYPYRLKTWTLPRVLAFLGAAFFTLMASYAPQQISLIGFFSYLELGGKHGLSSTLFLENLAYVAVLVFPIFYLFFKGQGKKSDYFRPVILLMAIELLVALIASKPGAGSHHLMPFIPIHAMILQGLLKESPELQAPTRPFKFGLLTLGLMTLIVPVVLAGKFIVQYSLQVELKKEVETIAEQYPGIVLAPSDVRSYSHVYFRPLLEAKGDRQVDYAAAMDLRLSGVSDDALAVAMSLCRIPYFALPIEGEPFALNNYYTGQPLFSDEVRTAFYTHYKHIESVLTLYKVYSCRG